jgi:hypothetical protein
MALTRKSLKAMGLTDEQVDSIVEMHAETVDGLKDKLKTEEEKANKLDGVQKELDDLKAQGDGGFKDKYEKEHKAFTDYKADVERKASHATKEAAVRAYLESKNITGANLKIAMLAVSGKIDGMELDGEKLKSTDALDELVKDGGDLAGLVVKTSTKGADTANPPANNGGKAMTRADLYKKDEHGRYIMSAQERQKALVENPDLMK